MGVHIVAISADTVEDSLKFAEKMKITFPLLSDREMHAMSAYGIADTKGDIAVPALFIVSSGGIVLWEHVGESIADRPSTKDLLKVIGDLIGKGNQQKAVLTESP